MGVGSDVIVMSCQQGPAGSLPSIVKERVGAQMALVSLAYSRCILCFEGSKAFEPAILACIEEAAVLGKRCGVGLSILTTTSPEETEVLPPPLDTVEDIMFGGAYS